MICHLPVHMSGILRNTLPTIFTGNVPTYSQKPSQEATEWVCRCIGHFVIGSLHCVYLKTTRCIIVHNRCETRGSRSRLHSDTLTEVFHRRPVSAPVRQSSR